MRRWAGVLAVAVMVVSSTQPVASASVDGSLHLDTVPAVALAPAVRLPIVGLGLNGMEFAPDELTGCDEMEFYRIQAGLPDQFGDQPRSGPRSQLGYGWRESNCRNDVRTFCCYGYWQNYISSHLSRGSAYRQRIMEECLVFGVSDIYGLDPLQKQKQACVTKVVYDVSGLYPWHL